MDDWTWCFGKDMLSLQKRDASNPLESSCSQKQQYYKRVLRLKVLRKSSPLERKAAPKVTIASAVVYNCLSETFTIIYE